MPAHEEQPTPSSFFMRMRRWLIVLLFLLAAGGIAAWHFRAPLRMIYQTVRDHLQDPGPRVKNPDPERYAVLCSQLEQWRKELGERHRLAKTDAQRSAVEQEARVLLEHMLPALMRCWIGTKWDFNGTADKPGNGKIACGYFVSTVLQDAGFQVNRYQLAQQASANIIHSFIAENQSTLGVGQRYETFTSNLSNREPGIYVCGLDTHVGFIVNTPTGFRFIHSSSARPWTVVDQSPQEATALQESNWRMLGNFTGNPQVIRTWLKGEPIKVKR